MPGVHTGHRRNETVELCDLKIKTRGAKGASGSVSSWGCWGSVAEGDSMAFYSAANGGTSSPSSVISAGRGHFEIRNRRRSLNGEIEQPTVTKKREHHLPTEISRCGASISSSVS